MSDQIFTYAALALYFAAMLFIGYIAYRRTDDHEDYMLGGRNLPPWVAALSAGASDMSGWLVMGLPGAIYLTGLIEAWIAIGLTIGAYLNWLLVAPRLRAYTEVSRNSITVPSFFENRLRDNTRLLRILSGIVILVFFTLYISAGMVAAGVFFESSFGGEYLFGVVLIGVITLLYTLFGGFLGASFTDVVQGVMMIIALIVVPIAAVIAIGGIDETTSLIAANTGDGHLSWFGGTAITGATILAIVSSLAWGLGYFGQPHIIVRFMALRSPQEAKSARRIGMSWMVISLFGAIISGLVGIAYMAAKGIDLADPETVVLVMSQTLLHPFIAGLVLAAVLAAIMSTISSQLIVSSSALVEDLFKVVRKDAPKPKTLVLMGRATVLVIGLIAMLLAFTPNDTILELVSFAWAGFGAAFGPLILLSLFWRRLTNWGALAGMFVGAATVFIWKALDTGLYELLPAFVLALVVAVVVSLLTYRKNDEIEKEFTDTGTMLTLPRPHAVGDMP
ncbi:sodium/proline symporter PutP [Microbacterium esteraromaticum]|uniref:Sodium/proline symporter n=1 Tax=Microbacterium esteraromaticum TaxID=57043 RepID=A0A939DU46_9MICO|nr:sodium/proline symporter PutP [Microbacterium esteraromaticum]MBN8204961.1 sodium/proline symporter PutP [Microbacterium esteraromaticum]MBN8415115.1 sodium/proline symporter PutP [Microbacterium esteraromaticum]MBN8424605.1 sodium/proline symporter PutP [Microbacterium esteraromaticum]MBY6059923.1 sodium/proline symporter PutP [Microbacterium esteraromaticum]WDH80265.1 sodium/proline symporter PutP [Microbacterium esteraromaticum]